MLQETSTPIERWVNDKHQILEIPNVHADLPCLDKEGKPKTIDDLIGYVSDLEIEDHVSHPSTGDMILPIQSTTFNVVPTILLVDQDQNENDNDRVSSPLDALDWSASSQNVYPKGNLEKYGEDEWPEKPVISENVSCLQYYVRNASRNTLSQLGKNEDEIKLESLKTKCISSTHGEKYWFHGTDWKSAQAIIKSGPRPGGKLSDYAANGAFYLNPSYTDCYDWLITKNSVFEGYHAILIYKFDPDNLSRKGEEPSEQEWRRLVYQRSRQMGKNHFDWHYVYQHAAPKTISDCGNKQKIRWANNGERAMQLVIPCEKMCQQIHQCLVACVFYQYIMLGEKQNKMQYSLQPDLEMLPNSNDIISESRQGKKKRSTNSKRKEDHLQLEFTHASDTVNSRSRSGKRQTYSSKY